MTRPRWKSDIALCLLPLIESGHANLHVITAACDAVSACARFNIWVQEAEMDRRGSVEGFLRLLDFYEAAIHECQAAVQRFHDGGDWKDLTEALQRVAATLNQRPELMLSPSQASNGDLPTRSVE